MKTLCASLMLAACLAAPAIAEAPLRQYESQVVSLRVSSQRWNEDRPWTKLRPQVLTASAVVIEGPYLLVEAQMVREATLIQVEKLGQSRKSYARVVHLDPEVNLALLAVDEVGFWDDLEPATLARSLPTEGALRSVRWKNRQLEVADSRVNRIEVFTSRYGSVEHAFMLVTTDLAGGGASEPVFDNGQLIGLSVAQDKQIARVLPPEIIRKYLALALSPDEYPGFPAIPLVWQSNKDAALAGFLGLEGEPRGVIIREVHWGSSACGVLQARDILLSLDGHEIDSSGNYEHFLYGRLLFPHILVDGNGCGDVLRARVLRDGREVDLELTLRSYPESGLLIPWRREMAPPPFMVAGGLIFRELDGEFLRTWGSDWTSKAPPYLVTRHYLKRHTQDPARRRMILLVGVLPAPYNLGYHNLGNLIVRELNSRPVDSIADLADAFRHPEDGFHTIRFEANVQRGEIVLDAATFEAESANILEDYNLPAGLRVGNGNFPDFGPLCMPGE